MCTDPKLFLFSSKDDKLVFAKSYKFYQCDDFLGGDVYQDSAVKSFLEFKKLGRDGFYKDFIVPCGKCIECVLQHSSNWALRLMHEASFHEASCFLTLTYSDDNLPFIWTGYSFDEEPRPFPTLEKRHLQLFFKRLRKCFPSIKFRYYACGEYGDTTRRPHYHVILFGYNFADDRKLYKLTSQKHKLYNSDVLTNLWGLGHCVIGDLTDKTASYVARYVNKKIKPVAFNYFPEGVVREFSVMSNRPGIGYLFLEQYGKQFLEQGYILNSKKRKCLIPRYYRKKLADLYPELYAKYEEKFLADLELPDVKDLYRRHQYREAIHKKFSRSVI